jgi:hypothetical protein
MAKLSDDERALWRSAVDNLLFLKQQQWRVTNYAALLYGAVLYLFSQRGRGRS